jgi:hypothetical protein
MSVSGEPLTISDLLAVSLTPPFTDRDVSLMIQDFLATALIPPTVDQCQVTAGGQASPIR